MADPVPSDLKYTSEHEWVRVEGGTAVVGITQHAQEQLGDVVFVDLPEVGRKLEAGRPFGTVESVKAVSDLYAPLSGEVTAVNEVLKSKPELVNAEPYGGAWMIKIKIASQSELARLLSPADYAKIGA